MFGGEPYGGAPFAGEETDVAIAEEPAPPPVATLSVGGVLVVVILEDGT